MLFVTVPSEVKDRKVLVLYINCFTYLTISPRVRMVYESIARLVAERLLASHLSKSSLPCFPGRQ